MTEKQNYDYQNETDNTKYSKESKKRAKYTV